MPASLSVPNGLEKWPILGPLGMVLKIVLYSYVSFLAICHLSNFLSFESLSYLVYLYTICFVASIARESLIIMCWMALCIVIMFVYLYFIQGDKKLF